MAPEPSPERLHLRALQLLDELHRVGFEQLRFSRSWEGQHVRLQIYPASLTRHNLGIQFELSQQFTLSDGMLYLWGMSSAEHRLEAQWLALLQGELAPRHLVGRWVLDFAEFARLAYGPDHAYREWFRALRPFLGQGYLPMTWAEDPYGSGPDFSRHVLLYGPQPSPKFIQRPPDNPFVDA